MCTFNKSEAENLLNSEHWHQFLESTAAALQINISFLVLESKACISVGDKCPLCGKTLNRIDMSLFCEDSFQQSEDMRVFKLKDSYALIIRIYACCDKRNIAFNDKACIARDLLSSFLSTLTGQWDGRQIATEIATLHQINHIILSMIRGDNNALDRVLDLILSAFIILFDAKGSWLKYNILGKHQKILTKGLSGPWPLELNPEAVNLISTEFVSPVSQCTIGIVEPVDIDRAATFLNYIKQEVSIAFEIDYIINLMESEMSLILGTIDNLVLLVDRRKNICFANNAAADCLEVPVQNLLGIPISNIEAPWCDCILCDTTVITKGIKDELIVQGNKLLVDWEVYPLKGGEAVPAWIVMVRDYTSDYRIQEMGSVVENMVGNAMFYKVLAHEIRNPLATLKGSLNLIDTKFGTPELRKYIDIGLREIRDISLLLDKLLLFDKSSDLSLETVDPKRFLEESMKLLELGFNGPDFILISEFESVMPIKADTRQLSQVIINLVKNSYEAMNGLGSVTIALMQPHSNWVEIRVSDNGPGIPDIIMNKLFKPHITTKLRGTGLGLNICSVIIQNHCGTISAENKTDGGAVFSIRLPVCSAPSGSGSEKTDVLLLADDFSVQLPVENILALENISFRTINSIMDLSTAFEEAQPSVLLLDSGLIHNEETIDDIRRITNNQAIVLGNKFDAKDKHITFLPKPINYIKLMNIIKAVLK